jgi:tetratricopeptide (TPR) repeat protein
MPAGTVILLGLLLVFGAPAPGDVASQKKTDASPSARFLELFDDYRHGDADAAIVSLGRWKETDVIAEGFPPAGADPHVRAALVMFFTETGMRKGTFGKFSDTSPKNILLLGWGLDKNFEVFSYRSYLLVKELTAQARKNRDEELLALVGRWYALSIAYCQRYRCPAEEGLQAMADHEVNDRPEVPLLIGSLSEPHAGLFQPTDQIVLHMFPLPGQITAETVTCSGSMMVGPDGCIYRPDDPNNDSNPTREAIWNYRRAINFDPSLIEGHLRLGRMLFLVNRKKDARPHLEQAFRDAQSRSLDYLTYVAALFLGDLNESENRLAEAADQFQLAAKLAPTSHVANLALGEALLRNGENSGWAEARHMFDDEPGFRKPPEPMTYYQLNQYWRAASDLRLLRDFVRSWR